MFARTCCVSTTLCLSQWKHILKPLHRCQYNLVLNKIMKDNVFLERCEKAGLSKSMIADGFKSFKRDLVYHDTGTKLDALNVQYVLDQISRSELVYSAIFPFFHQYARAKYPMLCDMSQVREICNLTNPAQWYSDARTMRRSILFHAGPTNSGKTHSALESFVKAQTGIYCCPLRLLAREISQKSRAEKVACGLVTGEERDHSRWNTHIACTVEMADLNQVFNVAVIDEIQIIAHEERGWAWTRALLGLKAKEIHVCGEPRAISIVERLCDQCGDDFEVREYERLTKLRVKKYAVGSIEKLKKGDCIVCFKRRDIYDAVSQLKDNGKETAMIYGKLPPSTKRKEAQKFNDANNACNILVATDAVGMGLNLNIKRIVFKSLEKGVKGEKGQILNTQLTTPEVLQIAGRAGRYGFHESGEVTTLYKKDINLLHQLLLNPKEEITHARILPTKHHYTKFSKKTRNSNLFYVLSEFKNLCRIDDAMFQLCNQRDSFDLALSIQNCNLPLRDAYFFALCPINPDSEIPLAMFLSFVKLYSQSKPTTFSCVVRSLNRFGVKIPFLPEIQQKKIATLEDVHNALGAYLWLSLKFPKHFPDNKKIFDLHQSAGNAISVSLHYVRSQPTMIEKQRFKRKKKKIRQKLRPIIYYH